MLASSNILIATPASHGTVTLAYTKSLFALQNHVRRHDIKLDFTLGTMTSASVEAARNYFATHMLENQSYSHLLFIDADQGCRPDLIIDMLALDEAVVGCVYPARGIDFKAVWSIAQGLGSHEKLQSLASIYVLPPFVKGSDGRFIIRDGFVRATMAGTGIMLIKRHVFERMAALPGILGFGADIMIKDGYSGRLLQCFRPIVQNNNLPLGEDLSFCHRWVEDCGGEIWVGVDHEIQHVGSFAFQGRYKDRMD